MHSLTFLAYALSLALASTSLSTAFKITVVNKCPEPISVAASQADVLTTDKSPELEAVRPFPAVSTIPTCPVEGDTDATVET
jgi:hypothetical protein